MSCWRRILLCCSTLLAAIAGAAQQAEEAPSAASSGFAALLWAPAAPREDRFLAAVRGAGIDGLNLPRGAEPAPLRAHGLRYYLDQPIGKGFLELRDEEVQPLRAAYERTRDLAGLVRPTCLRDAARLAQLAADVRAAVTACAGPSLSFVALADEASVTRHNAPLDLCRCPDCLRSFSSFALSRHGSLAALNQAWETQFAEPSAIEPVGTDQIRRRELGGPMLPENLQPWADWLDFVDAGFAAAIATLARAATAAAQGAPVGLTGLQAPTAFGGHDYAALLGPLTLLEPYDTGGAVDLVRSLRPDAALWSTWTLPEAGMPPGGSMLLSRMCEAAARGQQGAVLWSADRAFTSSGERTPAGAALAAALSRMRPALDACAGAVVEEDSIFLCESQASVRAHWMLDSVADGLTWIRRLASYEADHSTSFAARKSWQQLLGDLGFAPRWVGERDLPERLLLERPKLLVLPATIALSDRACRAVAAYVQAGGCVLADHSTALYDERLRRRPRGGLDALFGIQERSLLLQDLGVREGRPRADLAAAVDGGLRSELGERRAGGAVFVEHRTGKGRAVMLNLPVCAYAERRLQPKELEFCADLRRRVRQVLQAARLAPRVDVRGEGLPTCVQRRLLRTKDGRSLLCVRLDALDAPDLMRKLAAGGRRSVQVRFPQSVRLRRLGDEAWIQGAEFELALDPEAGLFAEVRR